MILLLLIISEFIRLFDPKILQYRILEVLYCIVFIKKKKLWFLIMKKKELFNKVWTYRHTKFFRAHCTVGLLPAVLDCFNKNIKNLTAFGTDGALAMVRKNKWVLVHTKKNKEASSFMRFHCIIYHQTVFIKSINFLEVMKALVITLNFVRFCGANTRPCIYREFFSHL